jgi:hypothetical protein
MPPTIEKKVSGRSAIAGELLINVRVIDQWNSYLEKRNQGKIGGPYQYPESYIKFLNCIRVHFNISYRELEKIVNEMSKYIGGVENPNYSTICKRIKTETCEIPNSPSIKENENLTIIFESSSEINIMKQKTLKVQLWKATKVYRRIFFKQDATGKISDVKIS